MDYDTYLEREVEKYYAEQESAMSVSNCCGVYIEDGDICPDCLEHCEVISYGEYEYMKYEDAMCDKADSYNELKRESNEH